MQSKSGYETGKRQGKEVSTCLVDKAVQCRKEAREQARLCMLSQTFIALEGLSRQVCFGQAYVFGSLTKPEAFWGEISDVDVAFEKLRVDDFFRAMAFLSGRLGIDVDVVRLEDLEESRKAKIKQEGIAWIKADCQFCVPKSKSRLPSSRRFLNGSRSGIKQQTPSI